MRGLMKGTLFEVELTLHFRDTPGVICYPNLRMYSYHLKKSTEVDRILITPWKIYFVEQKSYTNIVRGHLSDDYWMGITGKKLTKFYNPVMQNFEHIRTFKNQVFCALGKWIEVENYVVVPDTCSVEHETNLVLNMSNFIDRVWRDSIAPHNINVNEVLRIIELIKEKD